jgi:sugar phosphate permease
VATTIGVGQGVGGAFSAVIQVPLAMAVGIFGWRYAYRGIGIGTLLIGILVLSLMKDAPEDAGLPSIEQLECRRRPQRPKQNFFKVVCAVYRNPWTWPYLILMPIHMGLYNMFASTWAIPYITEVYGKTTVEATTYTMMMMLGLSAAMLVFPILSDRTGNRKMPMLLLAVITALTWLGLAFFSEWIAAARVLPVFMVGMGVTQGIIPLFFTVVKELNDPAYGGNAVGSTNMIGMLGSAVLPVIVGGVMDRYKVGAYSSLTLYRQGFTLCLILSLLALVCVFFTKETHCENIYHLKGPSQ